MGGGGGCWRIRRRPLSRLGERMGDLFIWEEAVSLWSHAEQTVHVQAVEALSTPLHSCSGAIIHAPSHPSSRRDIRTWSSCHTPRRCCWHQRRLSNVAHRLLSYCCSIGSTARSDWWGSATRAEAAWWSLRMDDESARVVGDELSGESRWKTRYSGGGVEKSPGWLTSTARLDGQMHDAQDGCLRRASPTHR